MVRSGMFTQGARGLYVNDINLWPYPSTPGQALGQEWSRSQFYFGINYKYSKFISDRRSRDSHKGRGFTLARCWSNIVALLVADFKIRLLGSVLWLWYCQIWCDMVSLQNFDRSRYFTEKREFMLEGRSQVVRPCDINSLFLCKYLDLSKFWDSPYRTNIVTIQQSEHGP